MHAVTVCLNDARWAASIHSHALRSFAAAAIGKEVALPIVIVGERANLAVLGHNVLCVILTLQKSLEVLRKDLRRAICLAAEHKLMTVFMQCASEAHAPIELIRKDDVLAIDRKLLHQVPHIVVHR